jgi:hypothetical protein
MDYIWGYTLIITSQFSFVTRISRIDHIIPNNTTKHLGSHFALWQNGQIVGVLKRLPSGNQTWLAGKSPTTGGFDGTITEVNGGFSIAAFDYRRIY